MACRRLSLKKHQGPLSPFTPLVLRSCNSFIRLSPSLFADNGSYLKAVAILGTQGILILFAQAFLGTVELPTLLLIHLGMWAGITVVPYSFLSHARERRARTTSSSAAFYLSSAVANPRSLI